MTDQRDRRVCVLGAGGFIGRHVVAECLAHGDRVRAVDVIDLAGTGFADDPRLEFRCGQLRDTGFVRQVLQGVDVVICLAPNSLPATSNADLAAEIGLHVQTTLHIAELAQQAGVARFVFPSSGGTVYGIDSPTPIAEDAPTRPRNAYGVSKLAIEHYLRVLSMLRGMQTVSLRISNPYGIGQRADSGQGFIAMAMRRAFGGETMTIWGDGGAVRDFLYIGDVARAMRLASLYDGGAEVINIGSGLGYSLREVARMVERITGRELRLSFEQSRRIDVAKNVLDNALAFQELGWRPKIPIEEGLRRTAEWWEMHHTPQG